MKIHFISTGPKFPYPYYIGVMTALKHCKDKVVLHILERPESPYFDILEKDSRLEIKPITLNISRVAFRMPFYVKGTIANMEKNWKRVMMFDYLIWRTVYKEGGVIMGLDSITMNDWQSLLPKDKEMLVPKKANSQDGDYTMHGVMVRKGSGLAEDIMLDIEWVMDGKDITGKHRAIVNHKYRWGGAGIIPFINQVLKNKDKVAFVDLSTKTLPMLASSDTGFDKKNEQFVKNSNHLFASSIRSSLTPKEWNPLNKTLIKQPMKNKTHFRFHIPAYVHLPCSRKYMACAFTQKIYKLSQMLLSLGHEVYIYGAEGSDVPCTKFIQTHSLADIREEWGEGDNRFELGYNWKDKGFKHDFNTTKTPTTLKFYQKCIQEINKKKKPDDFLLIMQGFYHKPIDDGVGLALTCEPGIGYRGSYAKYRAFESSYLQNFTYGSQHPFKSINGSNYDRVIPNYFDPKDFKFSDKKEDYFLFMGRLIKRKGIEIAYLVSKELKTPLKIAGQGMKFWDPVTKTLITNESLTLQSPYLDWVGYADVEQRKELMSKAKAVFVPTLYLEAFGGVNVEAQLSGTPAIATNFACFPETIEDGRTGFVCNTLDDFVKAAKAAEGLDYNYIRERAIGKYSMDNVKWHFQKWFKELYRVYLSTQDKKVKAWSYISK